MGVHGVVSLLAGAASRAQRKPRLRVVDSAETMAAALAAELRAGRVPPAAPGSAGGLMLLAAPWGVRGLVWLHYAWARVTLGATGTAELTEQVASLTRSRAGPRPRAVHLSRTARRTRAATGPIHRLTADQKRRR